jgi:hypothetical protein
MSHLCEQLVEEVRYLRSAGMSEQQLSALHHFSLKGRKVTFRELERYFSTNRDLRRTNYNLAERLRFVANEHRMGRKDFSISVREALRRWPL